MKISLKNILISSFCASLGACGGGGGGDGDGGGSPSLTRIDDTNGGEILSASLAGISTFREVSRPDDVNSAHTEGNISFIRSLIHRKNSAVSSNNHGLKTETEPCEISGEIVDDFTEVDMPPIHQESGSTVANKCVLRFGSGTLTINAEISYTSSDNDNTGAYTETANGFIIMLLKNISGQPDTTFGFSKFDLAETGNEGPPETFDISKFNYTFEFNNGTTTFFVTSEVTANIIESNGDGCPDSGTVVLTGSNNTNVTGSFNGSTIDVSINGNPAKSIACVF